VGSSEYGEDKKKFHATCRVMNYRRQPFTPSCTEVSLLIVVTHKLNRVVVLLQKSTSSSADLEIQCYGIKNDKITVITAISYHILSQESHIQFTAS
jgi:hypothetical protein